MEPFWMITKLLTKNTRPLKISIIYQLASWRKFTHFRPNAEILMQTSQKIDKGVSISLKKRVMGFILRYLPNTA